MAKTVTHKDTKSFFGSEDHIDASLKRTFPQMIFEMLSENKPKNNQLNVFEIILNLAIDHGPDTPSAVRTIGAALNKKSVSDSVADGIKQINDAHGGAIEPAMELQYKLNKNKFSVEQIVKTYVKSKKRLPGYGHRLYKDYDPRTDIIFNNIKTDEGENYINLARRLEKELENSKGKLFPINIDGAIAVALCSFGWSPKLGKVVFIIARTPGLCAHYLNNKE